MEQFGRLRTHQSPALNYHLNGTVAAFDREYANSIGRLGTPEHLRHRADYAQSVANLLLDLYRHDDGLPKRISTRTHTELPDGFIDVQCHSGFDDREPLRHHPAPYRRLFENLP